MGGRNRARVAGTVCLWACAVCEHHFPSVSTISSFNKKNDVAFGVSFHHRQVKTLPGTPERKEGKETGFIEIIEQRLLCLGNRFKVEVERKGKEQKRKRLKA